MAIAEQPLTDLAKRGDLKNLEDRWLAVIEKPLADMNDPLEALAILTKDGKDARAAELAWMWLSAEKERSDPGQVLALGQKISLKIKDNEDLRKELVRLYGEVYADRPELPRLLEASGLAGGRSVRRALRAMEICLAIKPGDFLLSRSDEHPAQVTAVNIESCEYTVRTRTGEQALDPDALGLAYDPVAPNDFRVLRQLQPERIKSLLDENPVEIVIGILHSHHGRIDSDHLEHLLSPAFLTAEQWKAWWTKAKVVLKRCPNVVIEGKNPVIMTYHAAGQTLEEEIEPTWKKAETPMQRMAVIDTYFREAKARRVQTQPAMIARFQKDLVSKIEVQRKGSPAHALAEALVLDRLREQTDEAGGEQSISRQIMAGHANLPQLMAGLKESPSLYVRAAELLRELRPQDWPEIYGRLLPTAPVEACDTISEALLKHGHQPVLAAVVPMIPTDFDRHLDAICWLWRGPQSVEPFNAMTPRELLPKLLSHLAEKTRHEAPAAVLKDARAKIKAALSADKYRQFREVIAGMAPGMASTIRRTVDRLDGLGQVVRPDLLKIIQETHPELYIKAKVDPWEDETVIFATAQGISKREEELNYLTNVKMRENAIAIGEAASHGDLSENSEYKFALEERDLLRARVATIQNELGMARLLTAADVLTDQVNIGTRVTLTGTDGTSERLITILGPFESNLDQNIVNYRAPLAARLKRLRVGDTVRLSFDGVESEYRIAAVTNALE